MHFLGTKEAFNRTLREFRKLAKREMYRAFMNRNIENMLDEIERHPDDVEQLAYYNGWMTGILAAIDH